MHQATMLKICLVLLVATFLVDILDVNLFLEARESNWKSHRVRFPPSIFPYKNVTHYSGYVNGASSNVRLHYWLVEAETCAMQAPLILWLNGGPGCSSLHGLLIAHGPFLVTKGSKLRKNPYSWNQVANIIYLESPAGVGFSYRRDGKLSTDDDQTALDNYHALVNFVSEFPQYNNRDFYISGESYAGVYIPTLAVQILKRGFPLKLKGVAIGNGVINESTSVIARLNFYHTRHIIDDTAWNQIMKQCCPNEKLHECDNEYMKSQNCMRLLDKAADNIIGKLSPYSIYSTCVNGVNLDKIKMRQSTYYDCDDLKPIKSFLNKKSVKKALFVKRNVNWELCNDAIFTKAYMRIYKNVKNEILCILRHKIPVLLFSGDSDAVVPVTIAEWFVNGLNSKTIIPYDAWLYREENNTLQVGGYRKVLLVENTKLTHATVKGAGHAVAIERPAAALHMIRTFIKKGYIPGNKGI